MSEDFPALKHVYKSLEDIKTAETLLQEAKESLVAAVNNLPGQIGDDKELRENVIWHLYWKVEGVQKRWIKAAFPSSHNDFQAIISKAYITIHCPQCKKPRQVQVTSKQNLSSYNSGSNYYTTCDECKAAEKKREEERSRAYWEVRTARLEELRTMPYREYLQTPEWIERRKKAMKRAGFRCQVCNAYGVRLNTHHRTYERRGNEDDRDLIVLCEDCHAIFHENGNLAEGA